MSVRSYHCRFIRSLLAGFALLSAGSAILSGAPFTKIDDFEGTSEGPLDGRLGLWFSNGGAVVADLANPANHAAGFLGGTGDRGTHVPVTIANGQTGTLFFRMRVDTDNADPATSVLNWSVGMSDVALTSDGAFGDYEAQLNQNRDAGNLAPDEVRARDAGAFVGLARLEPEVWYKVWLVINNAADTYEAHLQGGQFPTVTQQQTVDGVTSFVFRNSGGGPAANDLVRFFVRLSGAHAGNLYIDDVWVNPTEANLTDPTTAPVVETPPTLTDFQPRAGATFHPAEQGLSFRVTSTDPAGVPTSGITVVLNGQDITSALVIGGTASDRTVIYNALQPDTTYTAVITAKDASSRERQATIAFDTRLHYVLPAEFAYPVTAARTDAPGVTARVSQVFDVTLANSEERAEGQLAGELIDPATGEPYVDMATRGPNTDGSYDLALVNWNLNAGGFGAELGNFQAPAFEDQTIPGVTLDYVENMAAEVLAYLELPAGLHTMGVNSDDGFVVSTGVHLNDLVRVTLGRFDGGRAAADTTFQFRVETPGIYPFRLVWYQGTGDAALEWFTVDAETGEKILINDRSNAKAIKAWRALSAPLKPYVAAISPAPGQGQVPLNATISVTIQDGGASVQPGSVSFTFNGQTVTPTVNKTGGTTAVTFDPPGSLDALSTNRFSVTYSDDATPANVRTVTSTFVTLRERTQFEGFTLIDNFEGALGPLNGRFGEWFSNGGQIVADPVAGNNRVAGWVGGTGDRGSHIPATIPEGNKGTVFFRLMVASDNADASTPVLNWSVGMSDVALTTDGAYADFEAQLNQNRDDGNPGFDEVRVRDSASFVNLVPLQTQTWYKTWLEIDNQADTLQVFAQGGQFANRTALTSPDGLSTFTFRNGPDGNDLVRFFVRLAGSHAGGVYLDDVWIDSDSLNSADPTAFAPPAEARLSAARSGTNLVLTWPAQGTDGYVLQTTPALAPTNWTAVTSQPATTGNERSITIPLNNVSGFYRLRAP